MSEVLATDVVPVESVPTAVAVARSIDRAGRLAGLVWHAPGLRAVRLPPRDFQFASEKIRRLAESDGACVWLRIILVYWIGALVRVGNGPFEFESVLDLWIAKADLARPVVAVPIANSFEGFVLVDEVVADAATRNAIV